MICHYCGADHDADVICDKMFADFGQPFVRLAQENTTMSDTIQDESELTKTVVSKGRSYVVPKDVADELAAERAAREKAEAALREIEITVPHSTIIGLRAENERLRTELAKHRATIDEARQLYMRRALKAEAELAECRKDAERHRAMRAQFDPRKQISHILPRVYDPCFSGCFVTYRTPEAYEAAIDEARNEGS